MDSLIEQFLAADSFAVVGASNDPEKYGARVFAAYRKRGLEAFPVNPSQDEIQGVRAYPSLLDLPAPAPSVSVITPPSVTERVVEDAKRAGVKILWLQPGAESPAAIAAAENAQIDVIHGGPCILVSFATLGKG